MRHRQRKTAVPHATMVTRDVANSRELAKNVFPCQCQAVDRLMFRLRTAHAYQQTLAPIEELEGRTPSRHQHRSVSSLADDADAAALASAGMAVLPVPTAIVQLAESAHASARHIRPKGGDTAATTPDAFRADLRRHPTIGLPRCTRSPPSAPADPAAGCHPTLTRCPDHRRPSRKSANHS